MKHHPELDNAKAELKTVITRLEPVVKPVHLLPLVRVLDMIEDVQRGRRTK